MLEITEMSTKTQYQSKIALKETPTLKLGLTLVLTVTQVCIFAERPVCQLKCYSKWKNCLFFFLQIVKFHTFVLYGPCIFPSASPLPPLKNRIKNRNKSPMFSEWKQAQVGWNSQKPTEQDGIDTTILSHHPNILCDFTNCTPQNSLHAYSKWYLLNKQSTQHCMVTPQPFT